MHRLQLLFLGGIVALAMAGPAAASRPTSAYHFYACTGDPTDFWAVKTALPDGSVSAGSAFDLTDGSGTYQILSWGEGNFDPPGIRDSSSVNLICTVNLEGLGETTVYGHFAWTP